jgi:hypothetical protein
MLLAQAIIFSGPCSMSSEQKRVTQTTVLPVILQKLCRPRLCKSPLESFEAVEMRTEWSTAET